MVPLLLVAGFLGAGKTRFIRRLGEALSARDPEGRVVLYSVGDVGDTAAGGTACVSAAQILHALRHSAPGDGAIVAIEVSGSSTTDELLALLASDLRLQEFTLPLQLTIIDASRWQSRGQHNELERAQVGTATHVLLNWTDHMNADKVAALRSSMRAINPRVSVVDESGFADWLHALARHVARAAERSAVPMSASARHEVAHLHTPPFGVAALRIPETVDRTDFQHFVGSLPESVVRAKGLVRFADAPDQVYAWNKLPDSRGLHLEKPALDQTGRPSATFIGVSMPVRELAEQLDELETRGKSRGDR